MNDKQNIQAFILAGGKSSRMGSEKGLVALNGKPFVSHIIHTLLKITPAISILANNPLYEQFNYPVYEDIVKEKGPLGGIYSGLMNTSSEINLFVSCDIPLINEELIRFMVQRYVSNKVMVVSHNGINEPLCGIYPASCISSIKNLLDMNELSVHKALQVLQADFLDISNETFYHKHLMYNINSPTELKKIEEEIACAK